MLKNVSEEEAEDTAGLPVSTNSTLQPCNITYATSIHKLHVAADARYERMCTFEQQKALNSKRARLLF